MNTTIFLRQINASRCLRLLKDSRALSRSEIARQLNVTRTTAGYAVKYLMDEGLVTETEQEGSPEAARVGRPSVGVSLDPDGALFVGLDIGTTALTATLLDLSMRVVGSVVEETPPEMNDFDAIAARLEALAEGMLRKAGRRRSRVRGIGVSVPGLVDRNGRIKIAPFLGWRDVDLRARLMRGLGEGTNIRVCNDAVALANAICATEPDHATREFLLILMSEGIGSALVRQGKVVDGSNGHAGEIGQMVMAPTCADGANETFQILAGHRFFIPYLERGRSIPSALAHLARHGSDDPRYEAALEVWAARLTAGLLNAVRLLDPERIMLGGPVAALFPKVADKVQSQLFDQLLGIQAPSISLSSLGADGAAIGAAAMIREDLFELPGIAEN